MSGGTRASVPVKIPRRTAAREGTMSEILSEESWSLFWSVSLIELLLVRCSCSDCTLDLLKSAVSSFARCRLFSSLSRRSVLRFSFYTKDDNAGALTINIVIFKAHVDPVGIIIQL